MCASNALVERRDFSGCLDQGAHVLFTFFFLPRKPAASIASGRHEVSEIKWDFESSGPEVHGADPHPHRANQGSAIRSHGSHAIWVWVPSTASPAPAAAPPKERCTRRRGLRPLRRRNPLPSTCARGCSK